MAAPPIPRAAAEAIIVVLSLGIFIAYHIWLLFLRGRGKKIAPEYHDYFQAGKLARSIWAEACASDEKDAILGVQQARNAMSACTYLATISVALATAGFTIIFDDSKMARIAQLAANDPLVKHLPGDQLVPPVAILGAALGCLYASFICFAQSVRLYVHTGFYVRACTSSFNPGTLTVAEAKRVTINAGLAFTIGLRFFYLFVPVVMWSLGVTSLLVTSIVITAIVVYSDHFDMPSAEEEQATVEVLQRLTLRPNRDADTALSLQVTAGTSSSDAAVNSPLRVEGVGSSHPAHTSTTQATTIQLGQQSRRPSAAQSIKEEFVHSMV